MKRKAATIYAVVCTLLMAAGFVLAFFFAWRAGTPSMLAVLGGFLLGFFLAPTAHELGHFVFGKASGMRCVYWKAFCFQLYRKRGTLRFRFASPFAAEQTQMLPQKGGNMRKRASLYALGGLFFSAALVALVVTVALWMRRFWAWGALPYAGYLLLLNVLPVEYASGKTDALVYLGIQKGAPVEQCLLAAMEIQGQLSEGKSFGEIDEKLYFDLPTICEDEPLFAVLYDLRYRYSLDKDDREKAKACLNRLAQIEEYLSSEEREKIAAEFVYIYALDADMGAADAYGRGCQGYLKSECLAAKRILAAYCAAFGKTEAVAPLKAQAEGLLTSEPLGVQKMETKLLERIEI